ncbi:NAD(P)-binding protein [Aulographum hederae CBS 113979]|uniref:NAD(P)-binding protein n=1 Tax=Aulographum hederae CBS 113979 TaxID=1176131 RepID=A0A6G1GQL6_9PEZI|nr:NAD(P)-binding protein [Aulographum hederae CBS 113979]
MDFWGSAGDKAGLGRYGRGWSYSRFGAESIILLAGARILAGRELQDVTLGSNSLDWILEIGACLHHESGICGRREVPTGVGVINGIHGVKLQVPGTGLTNWAFMGVEIAACWQHCKNLAAVEDVYMWREKLEEWFLFCIQVQSSSAITYLYLPQQQSPTKPSPQSSLFRLNQSVLFLSTDQHMEIVKKIVHSKHSKPSNTNTNTTTTTTKNDTMSGPLTGKVALITGGSKGIGKAISLRLAASGANIAINYSSDSSAADSLVQEIGSQAISIKADAGSIPGIEQMVKETVDKFGKIDILIASAGIMPMMDLAGTTEEAFDRIMNLNVKGSYFLAQKAVPHMAEGSHIVFFSTTLATASTVAPNYLLYNTSKGAVEQMTRVMAKDLGRKKILVNAVAPGPTATELFMKGKSDELVAMIGKASPWGRIGEPEEIADAVAFLSGGESRWVSGQVLRVNGAMA